MEPTSSSRARVDASGQAHAGSQRQIQLYVNENVDALNAAILAASPALASRRPIFTWVSPLARDKYLEFRDAEFLERVGLFHLAGELRGFWPPRGPVWDGLAVFIDVRAASRGVLLVEAKSYVGEFRGPGCKAASADSRKKIESALDQTANWLGAVRNAHWTGSLYQYCNRLAHLWFLREQSRIDAWMVNLNFIGDSRTPTTADEWRDASKQILEDLGLREKPGAVIDVHLPALPRSFASKG